MRERRAGRFGGLLVGCWAWGPGGRGKIGRGPYFLAGRKGKVLLNIFNVFSEAYFDEFCIILINFI
jgi:hypothetical protein